jgi:hypothetical protein
MTPAPLRLLAQDAEDLAVLSAACQDSLVRVGDLRFDPSQRHFTALIGRFMWEAAGAHGPYQRVRAVLTFESVLAVRARRVQMAAREAVGVVLALAFEPGPEAPGGEVRLTLAGGGAIALKVECLDGLLLDLGPRWPTPRRPDHVRGGT